jgi:hypothetical protein
MKKKIIIIVAAVLVACIIAGTCVYIFKNKKESGDSNIKITATYSDVTDGYSLFEYMNKNPERYSTALVDDFGMNEDARDRVLNEPEEWLALFLFIDVSNLSEKNVVIDSLKVDDNGKDGVYIQTDLDALYTIYGNGTAQISVSVLVDSNEPSFDEVFEMIKSMSVSVRCYETPEDLNTEIPEEDYHYEKVS